jgi:hypothetical protein
LIIDDTVESFTTSDRMYNRITDPNDNFFNLLRKLRLGRGLFSVSAGAYKYIKDKLIKKMKKRTD